MVSLFLAPHDQYLIIFKDSNVFEFSNFSFQQSIIISVKAIIYSRGENKKKQLLKQFFDKSTVYLLIFRQNSLIFEGSPNSLTESYFPGKLKLGKS